MSRVNVRYIVNDIDAAIPFYTDMLGFKVAVHPAPGGWNRIQLEVEDIEATVNRLNLAGKRFRNDIVTGNGGKQILIEDPSGNPIELFRPF
jgi:catechol 2,3-dioxygenase-like lactoylglutathione lyase family enzyme